MLIETEKNNDLLIVRVKEKRLDARVAPEFRETLQPLVEEGIKKIALNLEVTEFIDSSGLGAIVSVLKAMGSNGNIAISNSAGAVLQMFKLTRMDKIFSIFPSEEEAVGSLAAK